MIVFNKPDRGVLGRQLGQFICPAEKITDELCSIEAKEMKDGWDNIGVLSITPIYEQVLVIYHVFNTK